MRCKVRRALLLFSVALNTGAALCDLAFAGESDALVAQAQSQSQAGPPAAQPTPTTPAAPRHANGRSPGMIELMNQIEDLQSEINRLRGQLEVLSNGLENAQKRQRDMYLDLDTRMRRIEQTAAGSSTPRAEAPLATEAKPPVAADAEPRAKPPATVAVPPATTNVPPVTTTQQTVPAPATPTPPARPTPPATAAVPAGSDVHARRAYDSGLAAYRSGDYQGAIAAFDGIVKRYPRDPLAANAQYWIGDAWFNLRDFKSAAGAQQTLINNYPDSPKVPDAMLNLGSAYAALGDGAAARRAWEDLVARYPQSDAAEKGRQRLARLK
jgi:tol-pal system protein YbgF